jgi:tetratricopeptide (TPR) repeat protein
MYLQDNSPETQQMRENILRLISSTEESNFNLAIQLMKGGGFIPETTTIIWAKALTLTATKRKPLLALLKRNLPKELYKMIGVSGKYPNNFYIYVMRYFDKLASYPYIDWERLLQNIMPYALRYEQNHQEKLRVYLLSHPQIPKDILLREWASNDMLNLYGLPIDTLPDVLDKLPHITYINIQDTLISKMPESFFSLQKIDYFYFERTPLENDKEFWQVFKERMPHVWATLILEKYRYYDHQERLPFYQEVLARLPERVDVLADILESISYQTSPEKYEQALAIYAQYKSVASEQHSHILHKIGDVYYGRQDFENALLYYQKWVHIEKAEAEAWYNLAQCHISLGQHQEAIYAYKQAIALYPYQTVYYQKLAAAYWVTGDKINAYLTCKVGLQTAHSSDLYLLHQAYLFCKEKGNDVQAEAYCKEIFSNFYGSGQDRLFIGKFCEALGDFKEAIKAYKYILSHSYTKELACEARTFLGRLYLMQGKYYEAEVLFFENVEYLPEDAQNLLDLACAIAMQEDYELAEQYLAKALHLQPSLPMIEQHQYLKNLPSLQTL